MRTITVEFGGLLVNFRSDYLPAQLTTENDGDLTIERDFPVHDLCLVDVMDPVTLEELTEGNTVVPYAAVHRDTYVVGSGDLIPYGFNALKDALTAMRLVKSLWIGLPLRWMRILDESGTILFENARTQGWEQARPYLSEESTPSIFGRKDLLELQNVLQALGTFRDAADKQNCRRMDVALSRLNAAMDRTDAQDKILDFIIALEALYRVDEQEHIGTAISRRACFFLEDGMRAGQRLGTDIEGWYRIRNWIVHGHPPGEDIESAVLGLSQVVRRSLRKAIANPQILSQVRSSRIT